MTPTAHLALLDRILAALVEAPATETEAAERIGTVACGCGHPECWRPASVDDVACELALLERHGLVSEVAGRWERTVG